MWEVHVKVSVYYLLSDFAETISIIMVPGQRIDSSERSIVVKGDYGIVSKLTVASSFALITTIRDEKKIIKHLFAYSVRSLINSTISLMRTAVITQSIIKWNRNIYLLTTKTFY